MVITKWQHKSYYLNLYRSKKIDSQGKKNYKSKRINLYDKNFLNTIVYKCDIT